MALVAWAIYDDAGAPRTGALGGIALVDYRTRAGVARTQPTLLELGGGQYGFVPLAGDELVGTCFLVDNGAGSNPRRISGAVTDGQPPFECWHLEDGDGNLWAGAAPTVPAGSYASALGTITSPTVSSPTAYLFAVTPSSAEAALGVTFRAASPAGAYPENVQGSFGLSSSTSGLPAAVESTTVTVEELATKALRKWLLQTLPAKCDELNLLRKASVEAPLVGPYVVPVGAVLKVSTLGRDVGAVFYPLTSGSRSAAQVAADINGVTPGLATVDSDGRVVLASATPPHAAGSVSVVCVGKDDTGANEALGLDAGGEFCIRTALVAPKASGVSIGEPPYTSMSKGLWIIIGDTEAQLLDGNVRRFEHLLQVDLTIMRADVNASNLNGREHVQSAVRAVREVLSTDAGRQLGRGGQGDVVLALEANTRISGRPIAFSSTDRKFHFDGALMRLSIKVFFRPTL